MPDLAFYNAGCHEPRGARRLVVPPEHYGAARRLLRDKIDENAIHFTGTGLDLGEHDARDQA